MPRDRLIPRTVHEAEYSVPDAWRRLKAWMAAHLPLHDPRWLPPAKQSEIRAFEKEIGQELPDDVRASYRIHNGQEYAAGFLYGLQLQPLERVLDDWKRWCTTLDPERGVSNYGCASFPAGMVHPVTFDRGWIPLTYDSGGNYLAVDLNPDVQGVRGQVIVFGADDDFHAVFARGWGQLLTDLADELDAGNFVLHDADSEDGHFDPRIPPVKHFHNAGMYWGRSKLGLKRLRKVDQSVWDQRTKAQ